MRKQNACSRPGARNSASLRSVKLKPSSRTGEGVGDVRCYDAPCPCARVNPRWNKARGGIFVPSVSSSPAKRDRWNDIRARIMTTGFMRSSCHLFIASSSKEHVHDSRHRPSGRRSRWPSPAERGRQAAARRMPCLSRGEREKCDKETGALWGGANCPFLPLSITPLPEPQIDPVAPSAVRLPVRSTATGN